ncbi:M20 family metallopeptidase [Alteribacillus sp. HJP-4]|uniref:M20 metallopeptidase family protein n=1 Tax=Alteribacillus sp. HJP-4 TaxID=2775394 RepID=UPI0035CD25F3
MFQSNAVLFQEAKSFMPELIGWRRYLHRQPELSFCEHNTTKYITTQLQKFERITILTGKNQIGTDTGVVGILKNGEGPVIALRADIDALPIAEEIASEYQSVYKGIMHACGHDAHTAMLLGAAALLSKSENSFSGTVKFIFQPAEEDTDEHGKSGAPYLIEKGIFDDVDKAFALHVDPENEPGTVRLHSGASMASVDTFQANIYGSGGHGAYPHLGTDPVWMLSFVLHAIQGISSRKTSPLVPSVISVGEVKAGASTNVIPEKVFLQGTCRSYDAETRKKHEEELNRAFAIVESMGGSYDLTIEKGEPALVNHTEAVEVFRRSITSLYPEMKILNEPYGLGGEDFGYIAEKVPAAMLFLGAGFEQKDGRGLHMPLFDIEEEVLPAGAALLAGAALSCFSNTTL